METAAKRKQLNFSIIPHRLIQFSNQELKPEILVTVRGLDVAILQQFPIATKDANRVADLLMELFVLVHTCKISFARKGTTPDIITAV